MKKYMLPGLITAMALSLPLAAHAQTSPTYGTQPNINSSPSGQTGTYMNTPASPSQTQMNMPASGVSSQQTITSPNASQTSQMNSMPNTGVSSQQQTTTQSQSTLGQTTTTTSTTSQVSTETAPPSSGEVIVGTDAASSVVPPLTIGMGTTSITVVNPTPKPVSFTVPNLNLTYEVPGNSQRTIQIDRTQTANLTPGQSVAYYINDSSGNQIASSNFTNYQTAVSQINTNTTVATEEPKQEPSYQSSPQSRRRSTVRGYW